MQVLGVSVRNGNRQNSRRVEFETAKEKSQPPQVGDYAGQASTRSWHFCMGKGVPCKGLGTGVCLECMHEAE